MNKKRTNQTKKKSKLEKTIANCESCHGQFPFKKKDVKSLVKQEKIYSHSIFHFSNVTEYYDICDVTYRVINCPICLEKNYLAKINVQKMYEMSELHQPVSLSG